MKLNELQSSCKAKIKPNRKLFVAICAIFKGGLTSTKVAGLVHYIEEMGWGESLDLVIDARNTKEKDKYLKQIEATTNVMTNEAMAVEDWRAYRRLWARVKKDVDIFFSGDVEKYQCGLVERGEWEERKEDYARLFDVAKRNVTDQMLQQVFIKQSALAISRLNHEVERWKRSDRNKNISDEAVKDHYLSVIADILFMKGPTHNEDMGWSEKWQMLYEHSLEDQLVHVDACAWLLGHDGDNFELVILAFDPNEVEDCSGIFFKQKRPDNYNQYAAYQQSLFSVERGRQENMEKDYSAFEEDFYNPPEEDAFQPQCEDSSESVNVNAIAGEDAHMTIAHANGQNNLSPMEYTKPAMTMFAFENNFPGQRGKDNSSARISLKRMSGLGSDD